MGNLENPGKALLKNHKVLKNVGHNLARALLIKMKMKVYDKNTVCKEVCRSIIYFDCGWGELFSATNPFFVS